MVNCKHAPLQMVKNMWRSEINAKFKEILYIFTVEFEFVIIIFLFFIEWFSQSGSQPTVNTKGADRKHCIKLLEHKTNQTHYNTYHETIKSIQIKYFLYFRQIYIYIYSAYAKIYVSNKMKNKRGNNK